MGGAGESRWRWQWPEGAAGETVGAALTVGEDRGAGASETDA